jgi:hypothetical protein
MRFKAFEASNSGFEVAWPAELLAEAEGLPIKNLVLRSPRGERQGELVITRYGLEGTPVYAVGIPGPVELDLKPDLTRDEIIQRMSSVRENPSPIRRAKRTLNLSPAALALLFHLASKEDLLSLESVAKRLKAFPLVLGARRPIEEAISSSGGLEMPELDSSLMLKRAPGVFAAGEMLDWEAPTGGYLIQACVSQGHRAGRAIVKRLKKG